MSILTRKAILFPSIAIILGIVGYEIYFLTQQPSQNETTDSLSTPSVQLGTGEKEQINIKDESQKSKEILAQVTTNMPVKATPIQADYDLVYTGEQNGKWQATLKHGKDLIDVKVGSEVPNFGQVIAVNRDTVIFHQGHNQITLSFSGASSVPWLATSEISMNNQTIQPMLAASSTQNALQKESADLLQDLVTLTPVKSNVISPSVSSLDTVATQLAARTLVTTSPTLIPIEQVKASTSAAEVAPIEIIRTPGQAALVPIKALSTPTQIVAKPSQPAVVSLTAEENIHTAAKTIAVLRSVDQEMVKTIAASVKTANNEIATAIHPLNQTVAWHGFSATKKPTQLVDTDTNTIKIPQIPQKIVKSQEVIKPVPEQSKQKMVQYPRSQQVQHLNNDKKLPEKIIIVKGEKTGLPSLQRISVSFNSASEHAKKLETTKQTPKKVMPEQHSNNNVDTVPKISGASVVALGLKMNQQLLAMSPNHDTIQIVADSHAHEMAAFQQREDLQSMTKWYSGELNDHPWYGLLYGQYPTYKAAEAALQQLPAQLRSWGAFVISDKLVQQRIENRNLKNEER